MMRTDGPTRAERLRSRIIGTLSLNSRSVIHVCGSTALMDNYPLERIMRDLMFYARHENSDVILSNLGKGLIGIDFTESPAFKSQQLDHGLRPG